MLEWEKGYTGELTYCIGSACLLDVKTVYTVSEKSDTSAGTETDFIRSSE